MQRYIEGSVKGSTKPLPQILTRIRNAYAKSGVRGSSNKEWDFFYGAVNLHARLKYHRYLVCPFGSSHATF